MKYIIVTAIFFLVGSIPSASCQPITLAAVGMEPDSNSFQATVSLVAEVSSRSGVEIKLVSLSAKRAHENLKAGEIDGEWCRVDGYGENIPGLIQISEPVASHPYTAYAIRDDIKINGWESLKDYKIAYLRGWKVVEINISALTDNLHPLNSTEAGIKFVSSGRADIFINIPFIINPLLARDDLKQTATFALHPPLDYLNVYAYLLPKHAALAAKIERALATIKKNGTYHRLLPSLK